MQPESGRFFHRETVSKFAYGEGKVIRQSGSKHEYAHVRVSVQPGQPGRGVELAWNAGLNIPVRFVSAVIEGIQTALERGISSGFQVTDIRVAVESGSYHDIDSTEAVFRDAAEKAASEALRQAAAIAMEAVLAVVITVHQEFAGAITEFINSRDGLLEDMDTQPPSITVKASLPAGSLVELMEEVITATQGRATISHSVARFEANPDPPQPPEEWVAFT